MIYAYPVRGKAKSRDICEAFVKGCGGAIVSGGDEPRDGPAFFYGVDASNLHIWQKVKHNPHRYPFYYCDNSYFDSTRQEYFRVTKNGLQHKGLGKSNGERFKSLGIEIKPWRQNPDGHLVVCPQSDSFMKDVVDFRGNWLEEILSVAKSKFPHRTLRVRNWNRDKGALAATLRDDLQDAHSLITWSSAAAITSILEGIPAIACSYDCAAGPMAGTGLFHIDRLPQKDRTEWAGVLADNQWTLDEFSDGTTWRMLNG